MLYSISEVYPGGIIRNQIPIRDGKLAGRGLVRWRYQRSMHDCLGTVKAVDENVSRLPNYLEAAGAAIPGDMPGRSLRPLLQGGTPGGWRTELKVPAQDAPASISSRPAGGKKKGAAKKQ